MDEARAALYQSLAEALDEPPPWLALPGRDWPLYDAIHALQPVSPATTEATRRLKHIPAEPLPARQARYHVLFGGNGRPPIPLYESLAGNGRLLGPESADVRQFYRAAGLEMPPGELPDHACLELAFLGHLAQQAARDPDHAAQWRRVERQFARRHPARWLPQVGRMLAASGDVVYAPLGVLLAAWLEEAARGKPTPAAPRRRLPVLREAEDCILCGFCVQLCPHGALAVHEDSQSTSLVLLHAACSGCGRCVSACPAGVIQMQPAAAAADPTSRQRLRLSPRARCRGCGQPLASTAELAFVARQIGPRPWLDYCLHCRT